MNNGDWKKRIAHEVLVILGILVLFTMICRLWPILLLVILGVFAAALRILFLSCKKVEIIEPLSLLPEPVKESTEQDVQTLAYSVILRRITELVIAEYPDARWIWETPNAQKLIEAGEEAYILLNRAGGYRRARVIIRNLQVIGIEYNPTVEPEETKDEDILAQEEETEPVVHNYELLAFEWADAHIFELNARCNEAIGENLTELVLLAEELPVRESWPDICKELARAGLEDVKCVPEGIKINFTQ